MFWLLVMSPSLYTHPSLCKVSHYHHTMSSTSRLTSISPISNHLNHEPLLLLLLVVVVVVVVVVVLLLLLLSVLLLLLLLSLLLL